VGEVTDGLQAIVDAVKAQEQSIEQLIGALRLATLDKTVLEVPKTDEVPAQRLINWLEITGEERLAAWYGLVSFVHTIVEHYGLQLTIRPCWWQHVDAIEELTALWLYYQQCFADPSNLGAALNWRDTSSRVRDRLREMFVSCRDMHVDPRIAGVWMTDEVRKDLGQAIVTDVASHPSRPQPPPAWG
jgi:hypothetical protein